MDEPKPDRDVTLTHLAAEADVPEGRALCVAHPDGAVLLYRWQGEIRAMRNRCPHIGTPLDLLPGRVFTADGEHLICATHGALFDPGTGLCVKGPCRGKSLEAVPIRLAGEQVSLEATE